MLLLNAVLDWRNAGISVKLLALLLLNSLVSPKPREINSVVFRDAKQPQLILKLM